MSARNNLANLRPKKPVSSHSGQGQVHRLLDLHKDLQHESSVASNLKLGRLFQMHGMQFEMSNKSDRMEKESQALDS